MWLTERRLGRMRDLSRVQSASTNGDRLCRLLCGGVLTLVLVATFAGPALAHGRVFVGIGVAPPVYAYPYPYPYGPYPYPYGYGYRFYAPYPPPYVSYGLPPPGWVGGHWVLRRDAYGNRIPVWIPSHLR